MYVVLGQYQENNSILFLKPLAIKIALAVPLQEMKQKEKKKKPHRLHSESSKGELNSEDDIELKHRPRHLSTGIFSKIR